MASSSPYFNSHLLSCFLWHMSMIWPFSNRPTSFQQPQDDFQQLILWSNLQRASSLSIVGLQSGRFSVQDPAWTKQGKCSWSRGRCKNTCSAMPKYPWARYWSHNCSHRALRLTAGTRSRALFAALKCQYFSCSPFKNSPLLQRLSCFMHVHILLTQFSATCHP